MNIGNFKSVADRDAKQKLQAEYLQLLIDNQAELERRVKNYQNPNIAPPVPPQYKTASELEKDSLKQEKDVIDNVLSISPQLSFSDASSVAEDLRSRGLDALVKFNRNFPLIKKKLSEDVNPKLLNAQVILAKVDDIFGKIDATFGLSPSGYKSENYFARTPQEIALIFPTGDLIRDIDRLMEIALVDVDSNEEQNLVLDNLQATLLTITGSLTHMLPTLAQLKQIGTFKPVDRDELFKILQQALIEKVIPSVSQLELIYNYLGDLIVKYNLQTDETIAEDKLVAPSGGPMLIEGGDVDTLIKNLTLYQNLISNFGQRAETLLLKFHNKYDNINKGFNRTILENAGVIDDLNAEEIEDFSRYHDVPLGEIGQISQNRRAEKEQARQENVNKAATKIGTVFLGAKSKKKLNELREEAASRLPKITEYIEEFLIELTPRQLDLFSTIGPYAVVKNSKDWGHASLPEKRKVLLDHILAVNKEKILMNLYDPERDIGVKYLNRLSEGKIKGVGFTSNDEPRERSTLDRISRVPNTQQDSSFAPNKSEMRRIKVGAGVSLKEDRPRYREFGKYRIHVPLLDENVINIKYPSLAGIPSLKPVQVSDQYIDFVKELLDTNDFNHKKYNALNPKEQDHFAKISKASGLSSQFGIRPKSEEEDDEDYKRLMILKGEYEAGNDNEKLIKELRAKLVKFINNGRIPRKTGLNYLMQLSV